MTTVSDPADLVVLLDGQRRPIGTAPRATVHDHDTPLHLAFSCYVFDAAGRLLVQRRAVSKRTWPGVWSNSCCGHPRPGENVAAAAERRIREELGVAPLGLRALLPDFAYEAVMPDGIRENEACPVFGAVVTDDPDPDPAEIAEWRWVAWRDFLAAARTTPWLISPWSALQACELDDRFGDAVPGSAAA
ncbi:MAG: isopentenyl-diphosphate Delta-isomerase [Pseudonocardia sp.]